MTEAKLIGGRYRPVQKTGRGPLGETFSVEDVQLARPAVLEVLQGPPLSGPEAKLPAAALLGLKGDLEKLARIRDPHLITLLDLQLAAKPPFLVYEPVAGEPLPKACPPGRLKGAALEEKLDKVARDLLEALDCTRPGWPTRTCARPPCWPTRPASTS
jgi:serine/threonine protein kinase